MRKGRKIIREKEERQFERRKKNNSRKGRKTIREKEKRPFEKRKKDNSRKRRKTIREKKKRQFEKRKKDNSRKGRKIIRKKKERSFEKRKKDNSRKGRKTIREKKERPFEKRKDVFRVCLSYKCRENNEKNKVKWRVRRVNDDAPLGRNLIQQQVVPTTFSQRTKNLKFQRLSLHFISNGFNVGIRCRAECWIALVERREKEFWKLDISQSFARRVAWIGHLSDKRDRNGENLIIKVTNKIILK